MANVMFDDILFPNVLLDHWQMMPCERIALTGLLSRIKPKGAIEIGVFHGGSLSLTAPYCEKIVAIDIDPAVLERFEKPSNAEIWIAASSEAIPRAFAHFDALGIPVNYILIDADHSYKGIQRDIGHVLACVPRGPLFVAMHDSGNPETRRGMLEVDWERNPYLHSVDLDFVPGQIIEHTVSESGAEIWGGIALAYLDTERRQGPLAVRQSALTTLKCLQYCADNRLPQVKNS